MKALTGFLDRFKIKYKLMLVVGISLLLVGSVGLGSFLFTVRRYNTLLYQQTASNLRLQITELSERLEAITTISQYVAVDVDFQRNMEVYSFSDEGFEVNNAATGLRRVINRYYTIDMLNMMVLSRDGESTTVWGNDASPEDEAVLAALLAQCDESNGQAVWADTQRDDASLLCARQIRKVSGLSLENLGYLVIRVNIDAIVQSLSSGVVSSSAPTLSILLDGEVLYPERNGNGQNELEVRPLPEEGYGIRSIDGIRYFITTNTLALKGVKLQIGQYIPYDAVFRTIVASNWLYIGCLVAALLGALLLSMLLARSINAKFNILVGKMDKLKGGDFSIDKAQTPKGNDELDMLSAYFDEMSVTLEETIQENYVKELLVTQAEFKALEQQLNPHFLYNTLDSINWLAKKGGQQDISLMVESLGSLLRGSLNQKEYMVPLEQELAWVSDYVQIVKIRFGEMLLVHTDIDDSMLHIPIPKMTIQPLVENAIVHSQDTIQEVYEVYISVKKHPEYIEVDVRNNGTFIDTSVLDKLRANEAKPKGNGIGLLNIDARLRIIFGEVYGLYLDNQNGFAVVGFRVPVGPGKNTTQGEPTSNV